MMPYRVRQIFKKIKGVKSLTSSKIFCISFQRNGTTSVGKFFRLLGYESRGWPECEKNNWSEYWYLGDYESIFSSWDFRTGQVFEDTPWWHPEFYKVLYHRFPESKFILFTRDPDRWFASMVSHSSGNVLGSPDRHCKVYRREWDFYSQFEGDRRLALSENGHLKELELAGKDQHYKEVYTLHNKEVIDFFESKSPESLFTCRLEDSQKWTKLGNFLGIDVPVNMEVHENKSKR